MSAAISQPIDIGIADGEVNLKHLLWQLREQQSALSDVTLLRQEVLSLKLSYNVAKAEFQPVRESIEAMREGMKKERETSCEELQELRVHQQEFTSQLQELRAQQDRTETICIQMISNGKDLLQQISDFDSQCRQLQRRMDEDLEASKRQQMEASAAQKAAERAEDLVQQLKGTAVSWERLTQLEEDLQHSKESVGTLREMVEQESSQRGHIEGQVLKDMQSMHRDLSELKQHRGVSDERMKELHEKLYSLSAQVLDDCKELASVQGRLGVCEKQGVSLTELQQNLQQLQSEQVLHSERLEHCQQLFDHEMHLHRSQEHSALSEELKDLQHHRERDAELLQQALSFGTALKTAEVRWENLLQESCGKLQARQAAAEVQLREVIESTGNLTKHSSKLEERANLLHDECQKLQTDEQVNRADLHNRIKELATGSHSLNLELERQKQILPAMSQQLQQLSTESKKMDAQIEGQLQTAAQQASALGRASEEIGKLQKRTEEQMKECVRLSAEQSAASQKQSSFEAWSKTAECKVAQLSDQLTDVHSQVLRCEALQPELTRLEKSMGDQARRNETAQSQVKELIYSSQRDLKVLIGEVKEELKEDIASQSQQLLQLSQQEASIQAEAAITRSEQVQLEKGFANCVERMARVETVSSSVASAIEKAEAQLEKGLANCVERMARVEGQESAHAAKLNQTKAQIAEMNNQMKQEQEQLAGKIEETKTEQAKSQERLAERLGDRLTSVEQLSSRLQALQEADSKQQTQQREDFKQELKQIHQQLHQQHGESEALQQRMLREITELSDKLSAQREALEVKLAEDKRSVDVVDEKLQTLQAAVDDARMEDHQALQECLQVLDGHVGELQEQLRTSSLEQAQLTSSVRSAEKGFNTAMDSWKRGLDRLEERLQSSDLRLAQQSEKLAKLETTETLRETLAEEQDKLCSFQAAISLCEHQKALQAADQAQLQKRFEDLHGKTLPLLERYQEEMFESKEALKALQVELSGVKVQQKELKDEAALHEATAGVEFQGVHASAERAHARLDALESTGRLDSTRRQEQRLEELQAAQWSWSADKAALESQASSSRQRLEGLEKTLEAYLSKDLLESVRSEMAKEMDHLRSRLAAAEQQQVSSGLELRKLSLRLDAELAGVQAALRERLSEALATLPPLEEGLREQAHQLEVKLSTAVAATDDLAALLVKEQKCGGSDVARFKEGMKILDTNSSLQLQLEELREAHGHLEAEHSRLADQNKTQGQELFDHFLEVRHQIEDVTNLVLPLADELRASEETMEGKLNSEQQRREMKEAAFKEQLESERAARELQRRELTAVLSRERQAFERLTVLERSILSVEELARREMEARARESQRLWDALDHLVGPRVGHGEVREIRAEELEEPAMLPCQPTTLLRLGNRELRA